MGIEQNLKRTRTHVNSQTNRTELRSRTVWPTEPEPNRTVEPKKNPNFMQWVRFSSLACNQRRKCCPWKGGDVVAHYFNCTPCGICRMCVLETHLFTFFCVWGHTSRRWCNRSEWNFLRDSRAMSCPRRVFFHSVGNNFRGRQIVGQETGSDGQFGTPLKLYTFQQSKIDAYCLHANVAREIYFLKCMARGGSPKGRPL